MIVLIPMAGAGSRFLNEGYTTHKPTIPTTDRNTGAKIPMVVAAVNDLPLSISKLDQLIFIDRDFHKKDGCETEIKKHFPTAQFITIEKLTEGQASTCLLAKDTINNNEELIIGACDNGLVLDYDKFNTLRSKSDALIFTYRNNDAVLEKPEAHGWVHVNEDNTVSGMSVKIPISENPMNDHAVVGAFWFKKGSDFVRLAEKMVAQNDRINNEFYVDQVMQHAVNEGLNVKVFEVNKYLCWGTPKDYEEYEDTIKYWNDFVLAEKVYE